MPTTPPSEAEITALVMTRLRMLGVDISVLPADDPAAPMDQRRALSACRGAMADTQAISRYVLDAQQYPPILYPAPLTEWSEVSGD